MNDVPVWGSSNKLKSWRIDEGYRRIRLEKGRNRILARVENGWHMLGWSVCISSTKANLATGSSAANASQMHTESYANSTNKGTGNESKL